MSVFILVDSFNVLVVNDFPARSGFQFLKPIMKQLALLGHNVTVISSFTIGENLTNYKEIHIDGPSILKDTNEVSDVQYIHSIRFQYKYLTPKVLSGYSVKLCEILFSNKDVKNLYLNKENKFDVILLNIFHSECGFQLAKLFGSPIIGYHATIMSPWVAGKFGLPLNPAVVPDNFLPFSSTMCFIERVENTLVTFAHVLYNRYVMVANDREIIRKYFGDEDAGDLPRIGYKSSLYLSNTHYTVNLPRAMLPNVIEVGGVHVGKAKPVPKVGMFIICLPVLFAYQNDGANNLTTSTCPLSLVNVTSLKIVSN